MQLCRYPTDEYLAQLHDLDQQLSELQSKRADLYLRAWEHGEEVTKEDVREVYAAAKKAASIGDDEPDAEN